MRRLTIVIIILLAPVLLGAVLPIGVAWTCALVPLGREAREAPSEAAFETADRLWSDHAPAAARRVPRIDWVVVQVGGETLQLLDRDRAVGVQATVSGFGWPWKSMYVMRLAVPPANPRLVGGFQMGSIGQRPIVMPYTLIADKFVLNSLVYALAIGAILFAARLVRLVGRIRGYRCDHCGYPVGRSSYCPECGVELYRELYEPEPPGRATEEPRDREGAGS